MAYAALVSLAQTTDQILNHAQYSISAQEKQKIKSIRERTIRFQAFLKDFPEEARSLDGQIRDAANEAEDIIECLMICNQRPPTPPSAPTISQRLKKYAYYRHLFDNLEIVTDKIAGELTDGFKIQADLRSELILEDMISCDDDMTAIRARLLGESSRLKVIPILGRAGVGKSALARNIYRFDPLIKETFEVRSWATVSQDYSLPTLFAELLLFMKNKEEAFEHSLYLGTDLVYRRLKDRRYLIVLDDVWGTEAWDDVSDVFPDDNNGSRIILTTRLPDVASYPYPCCSPYEMSLMEADRSWNLLRRRTYLDQDCPPELEKIGKEMARGCKGFPLAIVLSTGLLFSISKHPALWGEIAENVESVVTAKHRQFEEILSLSYTYLPLHLRPCFLRMGDFKFISDHKVCVVSELIELWIAMIEDLLLEEYYPCWAQLVYHANDLEISRQKIESIVEQIKQVIAINNSLRIKDDSDSPTAASSSKFPCTHKDKMIGFDDDLMEIKHLLYGGPSQLQVIPISGMGGIGKTMLAKNAYDDQLIVEYFHIRAWVTISQEYSVQEIVSSLLVSMEGCIAPISEQSNEAKVYKSLKGRRYLIVMDDMWSTKAWDDVRNIFPNDGNGSRIILTTRLLDVAAYPHLCSSIYEMRFMNSNQSWNLLHQNVFPQHDCPPELENIGKEIARSCGGLPLAIVAVAGLLSTVSKNTASWEKIRDNVNSVVAGKDGQFEEILSLSYTHLPHHLRSCFLYLGCFPEDHEIHVSKLVRLWVAEGFLKYPNGSKIFEEEAEQCLENLVKRSLVLVTERKSNGKIKSCSLHDLMRDLCIRKANEEKFLVNIRDRNVAEGPLNQRRLSIAFPGPPYLLKIYGSAIRTLIWFLYTSLPSLESFRLLRVLDAGDADVKFLPAELFDLFHLRYLAINYPKRIPASISRLKNLQTLIIRARGQWMLEASHEDSLPDEIWGMTQLRHLFFYGTLPNPKGTSATLVNLQTLVFSLSIHTTEEILKRIPNLRKLIIKCYDCQRRNYFSKFWNNLECLHLLETLEVRSLDCYGAWKVHYFNFPKMLKKLTLSGLRLSWNEMSVVCYLPNLQVLKLKDYACRDDSWETAEGNFPNLEYLLIEKSYLQHWITESSHFPSLRYLFLHDCWRLSVIPEGIGEINTLELIEIKGHVKRPLVESAKRIREEQLDLGNGALQVRCITH